MGAAGVNNRMHRCVGMGDEVHVGRVVKFWQVKNAYGCVSRRGERQSAWSVMSGCRLGGVRGGRGSVRVWGGECGFGYTDKEVLTLRHAELTSTPRPCAYPGAHYAFAVHNANVCAWCT